MYFIAVDAHSKWPEVVEMTGTTSAQTIAVLRRWFAAYGLPEQIVSDSGPVPAIPSDEWGQICPWPLERVRVGNDIILEKEHYSLNLLRVL